MALYSSVDGIARKIAKKYDGVDGVARNIVKAYDGVDGVARLYFSSGVQWKKWSVKTEEKWEWYSIIPNGSAFSTISTFSNRLIVYDDYELENGILKGVGAHEVIPFTNSTVSSVAEIAVGRWHLENDKNYRRTKYISSITNVLHSSSDLTNVMTIYGTCHGEIWKKFTIYYKGSTSYGNIFVPEGELPENGKLIEGSATGTYCILQIDSTYYYYERA